MSEQKQNLALFDFDGTLTTKDSLFDFLVFSVGRFKFFLGLFANIPNFALLALRLRSNDVAKQKLLSTFFYGWERDVLFNTGKSYSLERIEKIVRPKGIERLKQHLQSGDRVIIVSASLELWLQGWCEAMGVEVLATKAEIKNGVFTGHFEGNNCYGQEKVERLLTHLELDDYGEVYAYGDSQGDAQMLALADVQHYKPFRQ